MTTPKHVSGTIKARADLIRDALRFAYLAASEGIEIDGLAPEDFLMAYSEATGDEDWDTFADRLAAIQPDPEPVAKQNYDDELSSDPEPQPGIEDADMKRCASCGSVRDRRGMDCLEDGSWRCCDCIRAKPVEDGLVAMNACLVQLDMLVAESGRGVDWGEEDAFRMGEWFEDADLANIEHAKAFVAGLFRATPSSAGMASVEAAAQALLDLLLKTTAYDLMVRSNGLLPDGGSFLAALRALVGDR